MYKLIIFDVDGTLIDTEKAVIDSYQKVIYDEFKRYFTPEELSAAYGVPTEKAMENLGFSDPEKASRSYYSYLFKSFSGVVPFAGIEELLAELKKRGLSMGIVTSRNKGEVENDPSLQKLMGYFDYAVCCEDTKKHKPDAEPVLRLLEMAGADIAGAIYVGDTYYDYMCSKNAGIRFALALWGARQTQDIKADYCLKEPHDLIEIIGA